VDLEAWGAVRPVRSLGGGNRNEVVEVELSGRRLVARRSRRPVASLAWRSGCSSTWAGPGYGCRGSCRPRTGASTWPVWC